MIHKQALRIDANKTTNHLLAFIRTSLHTSGLNDAVIGLSGGVDSATSLFLAVKALGSKHVFPLILPYGEFNKQSVKDARTIISICKIPKENIQHISITSVVDSINSLLDTQSNIRKGNIMARVRMICLFDEAKKRNALVIGTENKTEHYLGYYTRFGDEASDIEPLRNLYKTQVYQLANYLNVPHNILTKAPSAGLWEGQTDEDEFGFTYADADYILHLLLDKKKTIEEVEKRIKDQEIFLNVIERMKKYSFKMHLPFLPDKQQLKGIRSPA